MTRLRQTWRWYGPNDPVSLLDAKQSGVQGIVHALHHIPVGEVWTVSEIEDRKRQIETNNAGVQWEVVESVNIHESIKLGISDRDQYIHKYRQTLKNLAHCGLRTVCYNFMPVLDWTRTDLQYALPTGSKALRFDMIALAAFDLFILKRENAEKDYSDSITDQAGAYFSALSDEERILLQQNILAGLPGTTDVIDIEDFKVFLSQYKDISHDQLRSNLVYFLQNVIPTAEENGIKMCIHPDDPPYSIFQLPRIVSTEEDLEYLMNAVDSPANGITFCTGSLGPRPENDLPGIVSRLGHRFHFVHLRNVQRQTDGSFFEADHLAGSVDMYAVMAALLAESKRRKDEGRDDHIIPFRPDHGHQMLDDLDKDVPFPGYSAIGRLRGLAELRGLELGIIQSTG